MIFSSKYINNIFTKVSEYYTAFDIKETFEEYKLITFIENKTETWRTLVTCFSPQPLRPWIHNSGRLKEENFLSSYLEIILYRWQHCYLRYNNVESDKNFETKI